MNALKTKFPCDEAKCTGCFACINVCQTNAIEMQMHNGFLYPSIDSDRCIGCEKCMSICPQNKESIRNSEDVEYYAASAKDSEVYGRSASGGIGHVLAHEVVLNGGVVCGAILDSQDRVVHSIISDATGIANLQNSKYTQSYIGKLYQEIERYLCRGTVVLFIGTPCQVDGLKSYLGEDYSNLVTADLFCKGVPSPRLFNKYINYLKTKYRVNTLRYTFRNKEIGLGVYPAIEMESRKKYLHGTDAAYTFCLGRGYMRNSCYKCRYHSLKRVGDLSLGDYHGDTKCSSKQFTTVTCNTRKGNEMFKAISEQIEALEIEQKDVLLGQGSCFKSELAKPSDADEFGFDCMDKSYEYIAKKYLLPKGLKGFINKTFSPRIQSRLRRISKALRGN